MKRRGLLPRVMTKRLVVQSRLGRTFRRSFVWAGMDWLSINALDLDSTLVEVQVDKATQEVATNDPYGVSLRTNLIHTLCLVMIPLFTPPCVLRQRIIHLNHPKTYFHFQSIVSEVLPHQVSPPQIIKNDPSQKVFYVGWINRCLKLYSEIYELDETRFS